MPHKSAEERAATEILEILAKIARIEDEDRKKLYAKIANDRAYDGHSLPIKSATIFRSDVLIERESLGVISGPKTRRGEIKMLSDDSLRRLAFVANNANIEFRSMITLTYPNEFPTNGEICKAHLQALLRSLKRRLGEDLTYIWFLEFQRRGAPHFHILLQCALSNDPQSDYDWLSNRWYKIVKSGDDLHLLAGTRWENTRQTEGLRHYVVKYAAKTYQKEVPEGFWKVGRFWGTSRNIEVVPILVVPINSAEAIKDQLHEWPFVGTLEIQIPRVLFNAAQWWATTA